MYYFWIGLLGAIALLWSVLGLRMLHGMAGVPRLAGVMPLPDGECPKVSILFAARDEAAKLPQALPLLHGYGLSYIIPAAVGGLLAGRRIVRPRLRQRGKRSGAGYRDDPAAASECRHRPLMANRASL